MKLYQELAQAIDARLNCIASGDTEWFDHWTGRIGDLAENHLPHGSGFDSGTTVDLDKSTRDRIVLHTSYHHMNEGGYYDGWTEHDVIVKPAFLNGFELRITGRDRDNWKDYAYEVFDCALSEAID